MTSQVATAGGARARSDLIDVLGLSEPERRALLARTHALESKIFRSVEPFETYLARVLDAHAAGVWVWTLVASDDALVGYNVITYHEYERADGPIGVYRANVGLLPEYRNHNRTVATGLRLAIPRLLRDGRRRYFFHAYLLHPSVYVMLDKFSTVIWPSARNDPPPAAALDLLAFFARQPGAPPPWEGAEPWVVKLPTAVAERDDELDAWRRSDRPSAKYYFERNPHSREGGALVMLVPLTLDNLGRAVVRLLRQKASRGWRR